MTAYTKDTLLEAVEAVRKHGSNRAAARALGVDEASIRRRIATAARAGIADPNLAGLTPPGYDLKNYTAHYKNGILQQAWIKPTLSAYEEAKIDAIKEAFKGDFPRARLARSKLITKEDLTTFYIVSDHHLGLYSWAKETGEDYDVTIAKKLLIDASRELVNSTPYSAQAVILNLGDFFHSDSNENRTRRSGNVLDVDTRFQNVLTEGVRLLVDVIEMAKNKHDSVLVRNNIGNHDPYGTLALAVALKSYYAKDPRVTVDDSPNPLWRWKWGNVLVASTHGDMIKAQDMPPVIAARYAQEWGQTKHRYIYLGHVHHKSIGGGEKFGATWETFRTLAAKDAWHHQSGYSSVRSMSAITHHKEGGEKYRNVVNL